MSRKLLVEKAGNIGKDTKSGVEYEKIVCDVYNLVDILLVTDKRERMPQSALVVLRKGENHFLLLKDEDRYSCGSSSLL
tara:strand:- start:167 stop:403 length:237 start_codon:yes stop_codon:yes gene_type:complete